MKNKNKLFAAFMNGIHLSPLENHDWFRINEQNGIGSSDVDWVNAEDFKYHSDWNWLMPVVHKIWEKINLTHNCDLFISFKDDLVHCVMYGSISQAYSIAFTFLELYRKQQSNNQVKVSNKTVRIGDYVICTKKHPTDYITVGKKYIVTHDTDLKHPNCVHILADRGVPCFYNLKNFKRI